MSDTNDFELLDLEKIWFSEEYFKDIENIQNYFEVRNQMKQFIYRCNLKTFKKLFGDDAERLWRHFFQDCGANLEKIRNLFNKRSTKCVYS